MCDFISCDKNVVQTFNLEQLILKKRANRTVMLNQFVPYRMVNLASNISNGCSKIYRSEFDISISEWRILARLAEHEKLNGKDIGRITFMDKSKVSRAIKILEEKQLIHRKKDVEDNRAVYLSLSEKGSEMYAEIAPRALDWEKELIEALDVSEYRDLMRIMEKLDKKVLEMEQGNFGVQENNRAKD
jgi:DNA-binding MarR family transcriptional regulator